MTPLNFTFSRRFFSVKVVGLPFDQRAVGAALHHIPKHSGEGQAVAFAPERSHIPGAPGYTSTGSFCTASVPWSYLRDSNDTERRYYVDINIAAFVLLEDIRTH